MLTPMTYLFLFLCLLGPQAAFSSLQVVLSNPVLSFTPTLYEQFKCNGVTINLVVQLTTSNYTYQNVYLLQESDAKLSTYNLQNNTSFSTTSTTDFISLTATLVVDCSLQRYYTDSFVIFTQDKSSTKDYNNKQIDFSVWSTKNPQNWQLQGKFMRYCSPYYGFNCDELCSPKDDEVYCYFCGENGSKTCCSRQDVNQDTCMYYGTGGTTPTPLTVTPDCKSRSVYLGLMITFIVISIILFLLVLALAFMLMRREKAEKEEEDSDNGFKDQRPITQHKYSYSKAVSRKKTDGSPFYVGKEPTLDNPAYDENSFTEEWIEPMPRRIARV